MVFYPLLSQLLIVVEALQIWVVLKVAGLLYHVFVQLLWGLGVGSKIEHIQMLCQSCDLGCGGGRGALYHHIQLGLFCQRQPLNSTAHLIQLTQRLIWDHQSLPHPVWKIVNIHLDLCLLVAVDPAPLERPVDLLLGGGEVEVGDILRICRGILRRDRQHQGAGIVKIGGEFLSPVELLQLHAVVVHHAVRGDLPAARADERLGNGLPISFFILIYGHHPTIEIHQMGFACFLQISEVVDHRGPLAAEGQVDEVFNVGESQLVGHPLILGVLAHREAVQPLGLVVASSISLALPFAAKLAHSAASPLPTRPAALGSCLGSLQLVHIHRLTLQHFQRGPAARIYLLDHAVLLDRVTDLHRRQQLLNDVVVLFVGDGEGQRDRPIFGMGRVLHHRAKYISAHAIPPISGAWGACRCSSLSITSGTRVSICPWSLSSRWSASQLKLLSSDREKRIQP